MCTAISYNGDHHLFGRTLDVEASYGERTVITPRRFEYRFIHEPPSKTHHAIIGTAVVSDGVPLYFDAVNESGLAAAGLNFRGNAVYNAPRVGMHNVASFELIPWLLCLCTDLKRARELLLCTNITDERFSEELPTTPLHFIISDKSGSITAEPTEDGLKIYDNPFGVLTNNPPFPFHRENVKQYMSLSPDAPRSVLCKDAELSPFSFGMGAFGLPGDHSSPSRFVRAVYTKNTILMGDDEVGGFFHLAGTVSVPRGCVIGEGGKPHYTVYTSCADTDEGVYYRASYEASVISRVSMADAPLDSCELTVS